MPTFEEFGGLHHNCHMGAASGNLQAEDGTFIVEKPIMVLDPDGELLHIKNLDWDHENDCWIISLEDISDNRD